MADDEEVRQIQLPVVWVGPDEVPVHSVNQFVLQRTHDSDEFYLVAGILTPPLVIGPPEDQLRQAEALGRIAVKPVARLALNSQRLRELRDLLDRFVDDGSAEVRPS